MDLYEITVRHTKSIDDDPQTIFSYNCQTEQAPLGALQFYQPDTHTLHIDDCTVSKAHRGRGIGKALLAATKRYAETHQPPIHTITAVITSKECLRAMHTVFGSESITVRTAGEFDAATPAQQTSARLHYTVSPPQL